MTRLAGQHAVITGGATGIGAAIAWALAAEGARISILGRRVEQLKETAAALDAAGYPDIFFATCDVTDRGRVAGAISAARNRNGRVCILVNNAGAAESAPFLKVTEESWRSTMAVNLDALFHCCHEVVHGMIQAQQGRIVNVASTAGLKGYAYSSPYVAAKHGAVGFTRALAVELAATPITVNAVCPGFTETELVVKAIAKVARKSGRDPDDVRAEFARFNPQGRLLTPEEVAAAVVWLCLPESGSINGQAIAVDGGETM